MDGVSAPINRWALWGVLLAVAVGAGLRLVWETDIEYKFDEQWMFERTQHAGVDEALPVHGMPTSARFLNPGFNVWLFVGLSKVFGVTDPPGLARVVQCLSIVALLALVYFVMRHVPAPQRELWLWAIALMALNPMAVLHHRKIWQPSLFPLFTTGFLMAWWYRERWGGAFWWGLLGALLGQVQMAGFFFAGGFFLWTVVLERRGIRWRPWLVGSVVGVLPLLPWLYYMATRSGGEGISHSSVSNIWSGQFWFHWITQPLGFTIQYALGRDTLDFMRYPILGGVPTFLVAGLYVALGILAIWVLVRSVGYLWQERQNWRDIVCGRLSRTHLAIAAGMWGYGMAMTFSTMKVHRHYLLVAMPVIYLWLAWIVLGRTRDGEAQKLAPGRACLLALCIVQGLLSANMLGYIHANQRYIRGDYRVPYGAQPPSGERRAER